MQSCGLGLRGRTPGRTLWALSALGLAAIVATVVLLLSIQHRVIMEQRTHERAMMVEAAKNRCTLLKAVVLNRVERLADEHSELTSLAQITDKIVAEFRTLRFLHETGQGIHAMVVDAQLQPVATIDAATATTLGQCAHHLTDGTEKVFTRPADTSHTGGMPSRLCYTCPIKRNGKLLGGLIIHKELDHVGDVFAALNRTMTWTVLLTQCVLFLALVAIAASARRTIAQAERGRAEDERLAALGNLAAGIAHETRNPLNTIGLTCRYLERFVGKRCSEPEARAEFNRNFEIVAGEVGRLTRILDNFVLLAKPTDVELTEWDLDDLVDDALALFARELEEAKVVIERHRAGGLAVSADRDRLQQVLGNLIKNGIQAMDDGGTLTVTSSEANSKACVAFADTGSGVGENLRHHIFEPYFSTKRSGLGLGLSLSRKIVAAHGGAIDVANLPDGGAEFTITLPTRGPQAKGETDA